MQQTSWQTTVLTNRRFWTCRKGWMISKLDVFTLQKNSKQSWDYKIMAWSVLWSVKSKKQLKKLDKKTAGRIVDGVEDIREDPYAAVDRLAGSRFFRLRMGD